MRLVVPADHADLVIIEVHVVRLVGKVAICGGSTVVAVRTLGATGVAGSGEEPNHCRGQTLIPEFLIQIMHRRDALTTGDVDAVDPETVDSLAIHYVRTPVVEPGGAILLLYGAVSSEAEGYVTLHPTAFDCHSGRLIVTRGIKLLSGNLYLLSQAILDVTAAKNLLGRAPDNSLPCPIRRKLVGLRGALDRLCVAILFLGSIPAY